MSAPVIIITGTATGVGKTTAVAAIAAALKSQGLRVAAVKPVQTGLQPGRPGDVAEVERLVGAESVETHEFVRLPDPLAPDAAARLARQSLPNVNEQADRIVEIAESDRVDTVLVEGVGGLLTPLDEEGRSLADLAQTLGSRGIRAGFLLVVSTDLNALNVAALTAEALQHRGVDLIGHIVGSRPEEPDCAQRAALDDAPRAAGSQQLGAVPAGAASLAPEEFQARATMWVHL